MDSSSKDPPPPNVFTVPESTYGPPPTFNSIVVTQPALCLAAPDCPDYKCLAIVSALFLWPLGLMAIIKSEECRKAKQNGDLVLAATLSQQTRKYSIIAIVGGLIMLVIMAIAIFWVFYMSRDTYYY